MEEKIYEYIEQWRKRGYTSDIPDEVPMVLADKNLAPSYKAIAIAILKNDHSMQSLGFSPKKSEYYNILKYMELKNRNDRNIQLKLFL